jgi:hypothetical protein
MAEVRNINNKPAPMGPGKILRTPRVPINKKQMKPKGQTRDYLKEQLQPAQNAGFGFGRTGMDAED